MFHTVRSSGIKGVFRTALLSPVTLFCGPNESGKTAISTAARLAILGDTEFGKQTNKLSVLAGSDTVSADIEGSICSGTWVFERKTIKRGANAGDKRTTSKHTLTSGGIAITPEQITGGIPVSALEFWLMTGEERWSVCEKVLGKFDKPRPVKPTAKQDELEILLAEQPPAEYQGSYSIRFLRDECRKYREVIDRHDLAAADSERQAQRLAQYELQMKEVKERVDKKTAELETAVKDSATVKDLLPDLKQEWELLRSQDKIGVTPNKVDTVATIVDRILNDASDRLSAVALISTQEQAAQSVITMSHMIKHLCPPCLNVKPRWPENNLAVLAQKNEGAVRERIESTDWMKEKAVDQFAEYFSNRHLRLKLELERAKNELSKLNNLKCGEESSVDQVSAEDLAHAQARLAELQPQLAAAEEWERWLTKSDERQGKVDSLRQAITEANEKISEWQDERNRFLENNIDAVMVKCDQVLNKMGMEPLAIQIDTVGKRPTLTIRSGTVAHAAMAGSQAVIYGAVLLHALQMLSTVESPVLFVEAAELSADRLTAFLSAMAECREKGNLFVAHWLNPGKIDGVSIIDPSEV